ncbi:MAG: putative 3-Deoxy-D-manno-octulosonate 8-phosphate phosphatase kdsC-like [Burkholderiaceae bacterium]|nr:putative 3-Deoxy-D-manno-octulosonate 8-phosphate phosphatase kdsC-like [Burkholderiaceae bacterium]
MHTEASARAARVKLMIFDVDGVLTDGGLHFSADGESLKRFNVQDGLGIRLLQESGVATAIITARQSAIVARRASELGIHHVQQGVHDKRAAFEQLLAKAGLDAPQCGFAGDDLIDLPVLTRVGFAASVANGRPEVRQRVHFVASAGGGGGGVREICEFILRAQGNYDAALAQFLS